MSAARTATTITTNTAIRTETATRTDRRLDAGELVLVHEVGLVENDGIGEGDLVLGLRRVLQALQHVARVDHRDDGVETRARGHVLIHEEGLGHGRRVGEACRLDHDGIEPAGPLHQA